MKRSIVLAELRSAGYHDDSRSWVRLYSENRISLSVAKEQWRKGIEMRGKSVPCTCFECKKKINDP